MIPFPKFIFLFTAFFLVLAITSVSISIPEEGYVVNPSSEETINPVEEILPQEAEEVTEEKESEAISEESKEKATETSFVSVTVPNTQTPPEPVKQVVSPAPDYERINEDTRAALVNILCTSKGGAVQPLSGSGIIIDTRGVILTNAHIGQYFLLDDYVDCLIRVGSPAAAKYKARLLYIPETWVKENAKNIIAPEPEGTGENDYAFLLIESAVSGAELPKEFPYIPVDENYPVRKGETVLVAAYPAGFLGGFIIFNNLYAVSSIVTVADVFTFLENTVDLFSLGGSVVAQKGASGGAVVNGNENLIGIVVTATDASSTSERDMRAISTLHINKSMLAQSGKSIHSLLNNSFTEVEEFAIKAPLLKEILVAEIEK